MYKNDFLLTSNWGQANVVVIIFLLKKIVDVSPYTQWDSCACSIFEVKLFYNVQFVERKVFSKYLSRRFYESRINWYEIHLPLSERTIAWEMVAASGKSDTHLSGEDAAQWPITAVFIKDENFIVIDLLSVVSRISRAGVYFYSQVPMPHNMATILTLAALQEQKERLIGEHTPTGTTSLPTTSGEYTLVFSFTNSFTKIKVH